MGERHDNHADDADDASAHGMMHIGDGGYNNPPPAESSGAAAVVDEENDYGYTEVPLARKIAKTGGAHKGKDSKTIGTNAARKAVTTRKGKGKGKGASNIPVSSHKNKGVGSGQESPVQKKNAPSNIPVPTSPKKSVRISSEATDEGAEVANRRYGTTRYGTRSRGMFQTHETETKKKGKEEKPLKCENLCQTVVC